MPAEDIYSGGRVYDQNSKQFKSGFVGLYAAENPDRVKGISLQFMKRADGSHRIRLTDNSKKGESADIGHITANISGKTATLSSHINEAYRGKKLAYVVYSEMAERLRAMGVTAVDGQIVNPDGIPIKVRERIIGDTRDLYSGRRINYVEGANRIRDKQEIVGSAGGIDVTNTLYKQARYQPDDYQGGDDYYKPKKNRFESKDDLGLLVRQFVIQDKDGLDIYNPDPNALSYVQIGHGQSNLGGYQFKNVEIKGKSYQVKDVMYFIDDKGKFVSQEMHPEATQTHSRYARENNLKTAMHPMGWNYADALQGRVEMPIYEKGKLVRRGVASIVDFGYDKINSASDVKKAKGTIAERLKISEEDFDLFLFGAKDEVKAQRGYGAKDNLPIKFQPAEGEQGGRTYTDKQMSSEFIGRYSAENAKATKGLKPKFSIFSSGDQGNIELMKGQDSIGYINFSFSKATGDALIEYTNVARGQQGKGYGNLLYSELVERLRSMGMKEVQGMIIDEQGRPQKIRERIIDRENARIGGDRTQIDYVEKDPDSGDTHTGVTSYLYNKAWYQPAEKIGTQSSNVKLLLEGMRSGRILRTSSYKGLGLEDSLLIAHTPDTAKIGQVTVGDKALADLQGGIFYAIANGKKIWASNFAGEGETNHLINFAKEQLEKNPNKKTYILLVKPSTGDNSKIFASVDGARGVSNIFKHLNDSKVMTDLRYINALKKSAEMHLKMTGLEGLGKEELYARIDDALLNSKKNGIGFKERANFTREIATQFTKSGAFDSKKSKKALMDSFHQGFERGFSKVEMERVFGNLMAEDIIKNVPAGHVYGALEITSPLKESSSSNHRGYDASIEQESGEPARLIMFDKTDHVINLVNRKSGDVIPYHDEAKGSYMSYTGGNIPYQEVKGKSHMPFQPAEVHGITPSEGFKWFKRNKFKPIPHEREIQIDNILNDVLENGLSYNEAAQKNNDTFKNVYRIVSNYVSDNPSAFKLTPAERVKSYNYKWFAPLTDDANSRVPFSKAIKIDNALDDIANKVLDIETASKKYQIPRKTLEHYIIKARKSEKGFPYFLQGINTTTRDADPYVFNENTKKMKVSDENKKLMLSMYEDEGLSVENEIAPQFGISPNMIYKFIKEQKDLRDKKSSMQPAEYTEFKSEQSPTGRIMRNAKGYVITMANNKFRVYNPAKAIIGVYNSEEEAKKRIYREIPKQ
jgi:GNAT superfamily N-acetyltransferase